jgi:hypothetical protein
MTITIAQVSVHGANGEPAANEDLTVYAELTNDADQAARVELTFNVDHQPVGTAHAEVPACGSQWASAAIGHVAAGGHDLQVVGAVEDGNSSSQVDNGLSFQVAAAAAPATPTPTAAVGEIHIRPHSNVEHPAGQAWPDERVNVAVSLTNTGTEPLHATVYISSDSGANGTEQVTLAAGEQQWVQHDFDPLPVGAHTFTAQATTETDSQSVVLGHGQGTLTVVAANAGYHRSNVQLTLRDFRGQPMSGRAVFVQFLGMDGSVADGAETVQGTATTSGVLTLPNINMPPRGSMRVMAVSTGQADQPIEGVVPYHIADGQNDLQYTADQDHSDIQVTATDMQGVRDQVSAEMGASVELEVLTIDGKAATEHERSAEHSTAVQWTVRVGRPTFTFAAAN